MANLIGVVRQLSKKKERVQGEMERLNGALATWKVWFGSLREL